MSNQRRKECGAYVTEQREPELGAGAPGAQTSFSAKGLNRTVVSEESVGLASIMPYLGIYNCKYISDLITDSLKATEGLSREHGAESQAKLPQ